MNKSDKKLIFILLIILIPILIISIFYSKKGNEALIYYDNKLIKKVDLKINNIYEVNGYNGIVKIKVKDNKIKVIEENSPKHICSKTGYISKSYESIICLPNKIVIKINSNSNIDTTV